MEPGSQHLPALLKQYPQFLEIVKAQYNGPGRYYHNWSHIEQLLTIYSKALPHLFDPESILLAIYYHDVIYKVPSASNEEDSAAFFESHAHGKLSEPLIKTVTALIIATKAHEIDTHLDEQNQSDCRYFLDIDMSILGADGNDYQAYVDGVRQEYAIIEPSLFNAARMAILKGFLTRERIFLTDFFHHHWEEQARTNIARELATLEA